MLSGHGERSHVDHALTAGARGYVLKGDTEELAVALRKVIQGEIYLSGLVQDKLSGMSGDG
jgi:DNA-binding NarL/FixJ family response regulator